MVGLLIKKLLGIILKVLVALLMGYVLLVTHQISDDLFR